MEKIKKKYSKTDCMILGIGFLILGLFVLSIAIPIVYVVLASFMDPTVLNNQGLSFHIKDWTLDAYRRVLENEIDDLAWIPEFFSVFTCIYSYFCFCNIAGSVSIVQEGICGKKIFQSHFPDYNVLWRWNDPDFYFNQSVAYGKYSLGSFDSWSI